VASLQQTRDQERAVRAWKDVSGCLDKAIAGLQQSLTEQEIKARSQDRQAQDQIKELRNRLVQLKSDEGAIKKFRAAYGRQAKRIPAQIQTNGLGQTLAFLRSKGKGRPDSEHQSLYNDLSSWVVVQMGWSNSDLLKKVLENDSATYRRATAEALAYLIWLKRFAEAELPMEDGGE
jgi:CRISPR-associated protein Cmr5